MSIKNIIVKNNDNWEVTFYEAVTPQNAANLMQRLYSGVIPGRITVDQDFTTKSFRYNVNSNNEPIARFFGLPIPSREHQVKIFDAKTTPKILLEAQRLGRNQNVN